MMAFVVLLFGAVYDARYRKVPNALTVTGWLAGFFISSAGHRFWTDALLLFILFYLLNRISGGGIGMGDVKLITLLGFFIGLLDTLVLVFAAMLTTLLFGIFWRMLKDPTLTALPFVPFLFFSYLLLTVMLE